MPPGGADADEEYREMSLAEAMNIVGSTGLLRTEYAGSSAPGIFRVSFTMDWFTSSGFLCNAETPCAGTGAAEDDASHVGAFFGLNVTPISWLEAYGQIRTYANSNTNSSPALLQVLGDTTLGLKAFTPFRIGNVMTFGGGLRVLLLNGAGDVGISGGGTSAEFNALTSADLRKIKGKGVGVPLRFHLNFGYRVDNSGQLVEEVETLRADRDPDTAGPLDRIPVSRIERFGLGINRVDFFQLRLGADVPYRWVQPYLEYSVDIPVNRQSYECHTRTLSPGDDCLALLIPEGFTNPNVGGIGYSGIPSRISLGARTNPLEGSFRGLSAHLGFDIGVSATSTFIEEVAPQAPWTLYFGLAYAFDTKEKEPPPVIQPPPPPPPVQLPPPPTYFVNGIVTEKGTGTPVPNAIISIDGAVGSPVATGADGRFTTREVQPGTITFSITAAGYNPGQCTANVLPAQSAPPPGIPPGAPPGAPPFGAPPGTPGAPPGAPPGSPPGAFPPGAPVAPPPTGPQYTETQCQLEAQPKEGGIKGAAKGSDGATLSGVTVELTDSTGAKHTASTGPDGSFSFPSLPGGTVKIKAQHNDYMIHVTESQVRMGEQTPVTLTLNKRPKKANVRIIGRQIQVLKKIHFELNSATIKGDSFTLLEEVADVFERNPNIKLVEIQGHTDNTGSRQFNKKLSQDRADSVRRWLTSHGVAAGRLESKGYGSSRPLAPNVTPANRARNRRVQFVIKKKN